MTLETALNSPSSLLRPGNNNSENTVMDSQLIPLWTQEQAIAFESARECITHLAGIYTELIDEERQQATPDESRIQSLRAKRSDLVRERAELRLQNSVRITEIRQIYGEQIKTFGRFHL